MSSCPDANILSIPRCLRHTNKDLLYEDVKSLTGFLKNSIYGIVKTAEIEGLNNEESCDIRIGFNLCFDLLQDKIDILSNKKEWPISSFNSKILLGESLQKAANQCSDN